MVSKRCFFHVSGFDPYDAAAQHRRFVREAARFEATWNVTAQVSAVRRSVAGEIHWSVTTSAPGWRVTTRYELLDWSDIVRGELEAPTARKLAGGLAAFADLVASGTARRYFAANWRYGMFFLVPFLNVLAFAVIAVLAGEEAGGALAAALASPAAGGAAALALAAALFAVLMRWPGERWRVGQALADWVFARAYMLGRNRAIDARIDDFAARIVACARRADADEVILAGHSLGATVALDVLTRAFDLDPALGRRGPRLGLLTIGATIPKLALHPRGAWLRADAQRLAGEPSLSWAEFQARDDFISFYKFDPVRLRRVADGPQPHGPVIHRVQIHQMLSRKTLRRLRFDYMRTHYQFVMANEQRTAYDYFMLMCGPAPFHRAVTRTDGPAGLYGADGSYRFDGVAEGGVAEGGVAEDGAGGGIPAGHAGAAAPRRHDVAAGGRQ